ncbi:Bro-N domain-containing protein [Paracoccus sp. (in: a-proteobacteria)]|uniref:Bro-N domain-containing protein n=1 Tax=Paracoccus sp. TaxID=267 RepID=UPI0026DF3995|nr:Bro-N domain-containing protein [Paracoccus sp. (in: a-proteobacteria)]MDO5648373.1 Bro-N domain-containing protein [Paracoccus sp. (in: a-proteobacteria)]
MNELKFHDTEFTAIDRNGQVWLLGVQIGEALGYATPSESINKIYQRKKREFSGEMTQKVKMTFQGQHRNMRVFSPRGVMLLAMMADTPRAAEFRAWAMDVLEGKIHTAAAQAEINTLRAELLRQNRRWDRLRQIIGLGLTRAELARALGISTSTLYVDLARMKSLGLIAPQALTGYGPRRDSRQVEMFAHV